MWICFNCGEKLTNKQMIPLYGKWHTFEHGKTVEYEGARPCCKECVKNLMETKNA